MVSEVFLGVASDQYVDRNSSPSTLHLGPLPSIISKRQPPVSSTIVRDTLHDWEIYSEKDIKLFTQSSIKSADKLLGLSRLHAPDNAIVSCL